ncbi:hypothetical protein TNCV_4102961 [Trichonephila clavipes]|nr:hypothetical protein TNCV_4102961 [Trichonephila clavipes]
MLGSRTDLHIFDAGSVNGPVIVTRFFFHMCVFFSGSAVQRQCTMSSHSSCRTALRLRILNVWIGRHDLRSQSHRACI